MENNSEETPIRLPHRGKLYVNSKDFYEKNPDRYEYHKEKVKQYYQQNKDKINQRNKEKRLYARKMKVEEKIKELQKAKQANSKI